MTEVLSMGGYGAYVWSAFGLTFLGMVGLFATTIAASRRAEREHEELRARVRPRRNKNATPKQPRRASRMDEAVTSATVGS